MTQTVILCEDLLDPDSWERHEVEDVRDFLLSHWEQAPSGLAIYHEEVSADHDVTPVDAAGIELLGTLTGTIWVVLYPGEPKSLLAIAIWQAVIGATASFALNLLITPSTTNSTTRNTNAESQNNALSERTNTARPNGRIPDIFGEVRSTPDLISKPYTVWEDNREVEHSYMCVGRGAYDITDVREDDTLVSAVEDMCASVYGPFTSPNSGHPPQIQIGAAIDEPILTVRRVAGVNGQVIDPPNKDEIQGSNNIRFVAPNKIEALSGPGSSIDFAAIMSSGDAVAVTGATFTIDDPESTPPFFTLVLDGTYEIDSVTATTITLVDPASVNSEWQVMVDEGVTSTVYGSPTITPATVHWTGSFIVDNVIQVIANFVCQNGCYGDNGKIQIGYAVGAFIEITPVDANDNPIGPPYEHHGVVWGSATSRDICGTTIRANVPVPGRYRVRARRENSTETEFNGTVVDECKWRDLYAVREVSEPHFGDVTTIQVKKYATPAALALTDSKLNCLAARLIPVRQLDGSFSAPARSLSAADIFTAVALDERIGRRPIEELDLSSIYGSIEQVAEYFGDRACTEFSYTFDSANLSYEETAGAVAKAAFCVPFRQGSKIRLKPELATEDSALLFGHRNTIPGSQTRVNTFGNVGEVDGVELEWVDPEDDSIATLYLPPDRSATSAQQVETMGIRNRAQAWTHATRAWNKAQHQHVEIEQEVTSEALLLTLTDRILIADLTRPGSQDGQVEAQNGLALTLSQPVNLNGAADWQIFLQHTDGTVESIPVSAGPDERTVILGRAPRAALSVDPRNFAQALYQIARGSERTPRAFLLSGAQQSSRLTRTIKAINYDPRYYLEDGLHVWMVGAREERSGYARTLTPGAGAELIADSVRGTIHRGTTAAPSQVDVSGLVGFTSYGFAAWVYKDTLGGSAEGLFGSKSGTAQGVQFAGSSTLIQMRHGSSTFCSAAWPSAAAWHHVTANYDATTGRAWVTIDGDRVSEAAGVAAPAQDALWIGGLGSLLSFTGRLDDVRYRPRPFTDTELRALYRATRK